VASNFVISFVFSLKINDNITEINKKYKHESFEKQTRIERHPWMSRVDVTPIPRYRLKKFSMFLQHETLYTGSKQ
jgi:hypothetical protein